nr:conserved hypothetical protein [Melanopsichium pennsylvanicum 4]
MDLTRAVPITDVAEAADLGKSPQGFYPSASFLHSQQQVFPALSLTDESDVSSSDSCSSSVKKSKSVTSTQLRALLASSMSTMYRTEVPLYGDLLSIVSSVNSTVIRSDPDMLTEDEISRLSVERHGAIRVGTPQELSLLARIFRVFGMYPVGYYDLAKDAGLPIHATAFRPVGRPNLLRNPFRIFCSLLRMDLIKDTDTRRLTEELLAKRQIVSDRGVELLSKAEAAFSDEKSKDKETKIKGLSRREALQLVEEVVKIFAWHPDTPVSHDQYRLLSNTHALVADIASFRGPHINHLTPRTLDIDAVQKCMVEAGIDAKEVIEGPPARCNSIYLRQTSFHALSEEVRFLGGERNAQGEGGRHKARFGEIEARGQALTRKGARLYDDLMTKVANVKRDKQRAGEKVGKEECTKILETVFEKGFTDERAEMLKGALGFWCFIVRNKDLAKRVWEERKGVKGSALLAEMVEYGALDAEPITYEDFLPASAAGIFQSNLAPSPTPCAFHDVETKGDKSGGMDEQQARKTFEAAVGGTILDYFTLYAEQQRESLIEVAAMMGVHMREVYEEVEREGE